MTREYEVTADGGLVRAIVAVSGRWLHATRYDPAEEPDASIERAWQTADEGRDDGVWPEREVRPDSLPDDVQDALIEAALMLDSERMEERCDRDV